MPSFRRTTGISAWLKRQAGVDGRPAISGALRNQIALSIEIRQAARPARSLPSERKFQNGAGRRARHDPRGAVPARGRGSDLSAATAAAGMSRRRPSPMIRPRWAGFMTYVAEQGRTPATETTRQPQARARLRSATAEMFGVEAGAPLYHDQPPPLDRRAARAGRADHGGSSARAGAARSFAGRIAHPHPHQPL